MNEKKINLIIYIVMVLGLILVAIGVSLILFTDVYLKNGAQGVLLIAVVIGAGLFLLLPAKIYLTLQMMKKNDEKLKANNK